ncbi:MAG: IS200/IS605 family transposase [Anaerolineales bacterium]|nr:IS200/IS605 family transposase [Anaerolineales bacterium]
MRTPYTQLYVHLVWATWDRLPLVTAGLEPRVYGSIVEKCRALNAYPLAIGGMPDHVHLLVRLPTTLSVADLVRGVKGISSHLVAQVIAPNEFFKWQGAYGAFTLSKAEVRRCSRYVQGQKQHHASGQLLDQWEISESDPATSAENDPTDSEA